MIAASLSALASLSVTRVQGGAPARVGIVGGGFGGASLARYLRRHAPQVSVTLFERDTRYVTCVFSNGVIAGLYPLEKVSFDYDNLAAAGVEVIRGDVTRLDPDRKTVQAGGKRQRF